jgi:hypothetical protein
MSSVEAWLARWSPRFMPKPSDLVLGDPEGEAVFRELVRWPEERVRKAAAMRLQWFEPPPTVECLACAK